MKRTMITLSAALVLLTSCSSPDAQPVAQPTELNIATDYFPLAEGAYWVYEGTVMWTVETQVMEKTTRWRMEVVEVIEAVHNNGVTVYVMKGHPGDLAWYEEGKQRSDYVIVRSGQSRYYYAKTEILPRLRDANDDLYDLVQENNLFLDIPLLSKKKFCEAEYIALYNGGYCWVVSEGKQVKLESVQGLDTSSALTEYTICQGTQPDDICIGFIPGVGISRYRYNHHGTISQVDVALIEYHQHN